MNETKKIQELAKYVSVRLLKMLCVLRHMLRPLLLGASHRKLPNQPPSCRPQDPGFWL